jgi:DNA helicase IV
MASRRSLNGSMTIVGDIAQATGPLAPRDWEDVLAYLPNKKEPRVIGLSVGYRIPGQIMAIADKVMAVASPGLRAPTAVREGDAAPAIVRVGEGDELVAAVLEQTSVMESEVPGRNLAIVCPDSMVAEIATALRASGIAHGHAGLHGIGHDINVVPVSLVKGLELDGVVVVEPAAIVADRAMGLRGLYVALTRATQRLTIVHSKPLPEAML